MDGFPNPNHAFGVDPRRREYYSLRQARYDALAHDIDAMAAKHPLGLGAADDLVGAYDYLASDASRWTTGSAMVVDGGYSAP